MSKASEYAKACLEHSRAEPRHPGNCVVNGAWIGDGCDVLAHVNKGGGATIERTDLSPADALALAAWIIETFGENEPKSTPCGATSARCIRCACPMKMSAHNAPAWTCPKCGTMNPPGPEHEPKFSLAKPACGHAITPENLCMCGGPKCFGCAACCAKRLAEGMR